MKYIKSLNINEYKNQLNALRHDESYDLYQTNVVYLTSKMDHEWIDRSILYSILDKRPKRAECYWFVNVKVTDEPYTSEYKVDIVDADVANVLIPSNPSQLFLNNAELLDAYGIQDRDSHEQ